MTVNNSELNELIEAGKWSEAIAMASEANRQQASGELECHLADIRLRACEGLEWSQSESPWPPVIPDPFPGVEGIPEISASELSVETLGGGILHHGSVIVRGLLDSQKAQSLIQDIDRTLSAQAEKKAGKALAETAPWFAPPPSLQKHKLGVGRNFIAETGGIWAIDSPRTLFHLMEVYHQLGLKDLLRGYFGEDPCLSVRKWVLRRVQPLEGEPDWHQDGSFMGTEVRSANLWVALNHCGGETSTPGIDLIPKRLEHIVQTGTDGARFDWTVGPAYVEKHFQDSLSVRPEFYPGDAVFFDQFNLHRTAYSPQMDNARYAIECWFFAPSSYPMKQIPLMF